MIRARIKPEIEPRFVWYMLLAPQARSFLRERATGTAGNMPKINQRTLSVLPVPLPPPDVRAAIVQRLDRAFDVAATTVKRLDRLSTQIDRTKQAALTRAFRGELVPTEAALAEEEDRDYESADGLLARIEQQAVPPSRRSRGQPPTSAEAAQRS